MLGDVRDLSLERHGEFDVVPMGNVSMGTKIFSWNLEYHFALREFVAWGGDPIGGITSDTALFGSIGELCGQPEPLPLPNHFSID